MDEQFARPPQSFRRLAQEFVCVRVTDMQAIDLDRYAFDFDTTLAVLFANADGTIYHRFGGRTAEDPAAYQSMPALERVMRIALAAHRGHRTVPRRKRPKRTVYDYETFRKRMDKKPKRPSCIHCHTIHEAQIREQRARGTFRREDIWIWPAPTRIGLELDPVAQSKVIQVHKGSPAAKAGLRPGDVIERAGSQAIATVHDLQWVLHRTAPAGGALPVRYRRGEAVEDANLSLPAGFKKTDPRTYAWRPFKWGLVPKPGFGGPMLTVSDKKRLGLPPKPWAFRVQYIVNWGPEPAQGRANQKAGLRQGDIVTSYAGKRDFASMPHFHAWVRLTRKRGEQVEIEVLRNGQRRTLRVRLL